MSNCQYRILYNLSLHENRPIPRYTSHTLLNIEGNNDREKILFDNIYKKKRKKESKNGWRKWKKIERDDVTDGDAASDLFEIFYLDITCESLL